MKLELDIKYFCCTLCYSTVDCCFGVCDTYFLDRKMAYSGQILHRQCDQQEPSVLSKALTVIDCIELFNSINACPTDESIDRLG